MSVNPFSLTFGKVPANYIAREENKEEIIEAFAAEPSLCQTYMIGGIRGCGKTVLMTAVAKELEEKKNWVCVDLNPTFELLDDLANNMTYVLKKHDLLERGIDLNIAGFGAGVGGKTQTENSVNVIKEGLDLLKKKGKRLLITIDEVENNDNMRRFASQFQIFIRRDYPVYLIMTGLYENIFNIQNDSALTFLLRSPKILPGPLSYTRIAGRYKELLGTDELKAEELAGLTKGYAFAFQALGRVYWENRKKADKEKIMTEYEAYLEEYVYSKIWRGLTSIEKKIILSMKDDGAVKTAIICEQSGVTSAAFSKYRERLILKELVRSAGHGYLELTLPRFSTICRRLSMAE